MLRRDVLGVTAALAFLSLASCEDAGKKSAENAREHVQFVAEAAAQDVEEVRAGLPEGAKKLEATFREALPGVPDAQTASKALASTRDAVQDLRVAKSTFFALTSDDGKILRNDREQDDMVGKDIFAAFPELKRALEKGYIETRGSMPEATGVRGREDGQWVAATPVKVDGQARGLYVTGWSWSAYAFRLENGVRSKVLGDTPEGGKVPLLYVYVIVGSEVYGAPVSPTVNAEAIAAQKPLEKAQGGESFVTELEITGREFGLAVKRVEQLGKDVAVAVLRSET